MPTPAEILRWWEQRWEKEIRRPLSPRERGDFLRSEEVRRMSRLDGRDVRVAIANNRELKLAVIDAEMRYAKRVAPRKNGGSKPKPKMGRRQPGGKYQSNSLLRP